ncbi:MAG: MFS transporter [Proteobacteria bacterium]|nr:MFS transporter [Pseudomonadota bacterium]
MTDAAGHPVSPVPSGDALVMLAGAMLSVIGFATFLLLPPFIEVVATRLGYSESQLGVLSALIMSGQTLASLASSQWVRRAGWRRAATLSLAGLLLANLASIPVRGFAAFCVLQCLGGFCGGSLYSLSLTVLSDCRRPDRGFAYAVGAQTLYQVFTFFAGPVLAAHGGVVAFLGLFAALCIGGFVLVRWLPAHGRDRAPAVAAGGLLTAPAVLALAGCFLFYVNVNAYWTYIERIGTAAGLGVSAVSNSLAFSNAASLGGVALAAWLGFRRGLLLPIAVSAVAVVGSVLLLLGPVPLSAFLVSAVLYGNAWNLSITYQYGTVHAVDRTRRGVALAPAFHNAGGAAGPALAALFVSERNHDSVIWLVTASVLASLACFALGLALRARSRPA